MSRRVLHVGSSTERIIKKRPYFSPPAWEEVRLDIDPGCKPDIVASMTDMAVVPSGSFDALFSSHNLEHLYAHEVPVALAEFRRVLKPDGFALITCPDLVTIAEAIAKGEINKPGYDSESGPVYPLDMLYGSRSKIERGNHFMAHRTGFTNETLVAALLGVKFATAYATRNRLGWTLWAIAFPTKAEHSVADSLIRSLFPAHLNLPSVSRSRRTP